VTLGTIAFATFLWWFSTGVIFYLNARPAQTFRWSMLGGTIVLAGALYGYWVSAGSTTVASAFIAFTCGLVIWGWHTMSYYMGIITGPRNEARDPDSSGRDRFFQAVATSIYHELAIVATIALMAWLSWGQPNQFGLWTFLALWGMHVSAKLNVFLGVRNLNVEFIPERLSYLTSYFRKRPMNLLFPFSVTLGTLLTMALVQQAGAPDVDAFSKAGYVLLASLVALAVIEHWFMILPIPAEELWRWSLKPKQDRADRDAAESAGLAEARSRIDGKKPISALPKKAEPIQPLTRSANS
jgi:putative photosynthetic complex assembly protein 2